MPNVIWNYNKGINGFQDARIKGLGTQVSSFIEEGLGNKGKKDSVIPYLYNEVKSNRQTERVSVTEGYDLMDPTIDGDNAKNDKANVIGDKLVSHIQFTKAITLTEVMLEDADYQMSPDIEIASRAIPDSYWRTRETIGQGAYINGESESFKFRGAPIDTTCYDGMPLFSANHKWGNKSNEDGIGRDGGEQSNLYYVKLGEGYNAGNIAEVLSAGSTIINQMLNSNGEAQGFDADTVLVPRGIKTNKFTDLVRRAIGSDFFPGTADNDINTQAGQWHFVPMTLWHPDTAEIILVSSEAKNMMKSMFYNRVDLEVNVWQTPGTGNINYRGRSRFSTCFVDYKHAVKIKFTTDDIEGATKLEI